MATTTAWLPKTAAQAWTSVGSATAARIERHLVGPGPEDGPHLVDRADAAADRQRDEDLAGGPLDDLEERRPTLGCRRDVEVDELVGAFRRVATGEGRWIALVDEIDEAGPLDDAAVRHVETGDDPAAEHQPVTGPAAALVTGDVATERESRNAAAMATTLARSRRPSGPLRSGWNWTPSRLPRATALTNGPPWLVSARIQSDAVGAGLPANEWTK